ncbi:MAG: fimbrillin family protein [Duncaniella sp.]|nr:fimbrillin family protein [Duncaniella sp.]
MKFSKYLYIASLAAFGSMALTSCGESKENEPGTNPGTTPSEKALKISTNVLTEAQVTTELGEAATMNVFVKTGSSLSSQDFVKGVKATFQNGAWGLSPVVEFTTQNNALFVYAVSPFKASGSFDPLRYPVDITEQQDVLYSGAAAAANYSQGITTAKLTMKHALAMASFNISKSGYAGEGKLTGLSVNGETIFTEGDLDISTGNITGTNRKAFTVDYDKTIDAAGWKADLPSMWLIPASTKASPATLTATIDGKTYDVTFPQVDIRGGFQTIFHLILSPNGLVFRPDQTQTVSLNQGTDDPQLAQLYGQLVFKVNAAEFSFPTFSGDNVFGNIVAGNTMLNYAIGGKVILSAGTATDVVVETWNSTGFTLDTLEGVESVDISQY